MANLFVCVYGNLKNVHSFDEIYCWVDSSIVFAWVNNVCKFYKQYIQSRLINIRNSVEPETWKLIPSEQNIVSRGIKVKDFISSKLWFNGPDFLTLPANLWPKLNIGDQFICDIPSEEKVSKNVSDDKSNARLKIVAYNVNVNVNNAHISSIIDVNKYNSLVKLLNITKLVLKAVKIFKRKVTIKIRTNETELNKQELEQESLTEDSDVPIGTCKKNWIQDV